MRIFFIIFLLFSFNLVAENKYQIGDEWGKTPIDLTKNDLNLSLMKQNLIKMTGRINGSASFYLGEFDKKHLIATNHHVCPNGVMCLSQFVRFSNLISIEDDYEVWGKVITFIGTFKEIDLTILEIKIDKNDEAILKEVAKNFSFTSKPLQDQKLFTVGYGIHNNKNRLVAFNEDEDCKIFSKDFEVKLLSDPDSINRVDYKVWSIATGCDLSHGDSGSLVADRITGEIIGIAWTGKTPKGPDTIFSNKLREWQDRGNEKIWKELSYVVPSIKIYEIIEESYEKKISPKFFPAIKEFLNILYK